MGIPGLLPFVRRACYEGNLADFSGQTILVDASCFIHRGLFGCAGKVAMGEDTHFYIGYVRKYVHFLLAQRCHVVFDGRPLPAKRGCNQARRETHRGYQQLGERGLTVEAERAFTRGTELTREVVERTIRHCAQQHHRRLPKRGPVRHGHLRPGAGQLRDERDAEGRRGDAADQPVHSDHVALCDGQLWLPGIGAAHLHGHEQAIESRGVGRTDWTDSS